MSDLICRKTLMRCPTPGTCSPHGGCQSQHDRDSSELRRLCAERDTLRTANQRLESEVKRLREAVREFAGFFSSDDPKHWELHGLADGADYSAALTTNGEVTE